jgi:hypothetical protein
MDMEQRSLPHLQELPTVGENVWRPFIGLPLEEKLVRLEQYESPVRAAIAMCIFGPKLAGDLGYRSTRGHPTTDYGTARFVDELIER